MDLDEKITGDEIEMMLTRSKQDIIGVSELNQIPIVDCGEPLVKIVDYIPNVEISMIARRRRFEDETLWLREGIAQSLANVSESVYPYRLRVYDAFRPIEVQQKSFERVCKRIKEQMPNLSNAQIEERAFVYVFPPSWDPQRPPPHSTGAAIDLTLIDQRGFEIDVGSSYVDFNSPLMYTNAKGLSAEQRNNRIKLIRAMASEGFINYPGEWWHFSKQDREWVAYLGRKTPAKYSSIKDPYVGLGK